MRPQQAEQSAPTTEAADSPGSSDEKSDNTVDAEFEEADNSKK